jgi:3-deoxy-D-manno-octulosonic-acid transferase
MYFVYNAILYLASIICSPLLLLLLFINRRYCAGFFQKLGIISWEPLMQTANSRPVWIHAVSVGEVTAAIPLVKEIKQLFPEAPIVLSTSTATGNLTARQYPYLIDHIIFFPFDYPFIVRRFIGRIRARVFIALETELWPNFLQELRRQGIPALMVSGRISPRSFRNYRALRFLFKNVLEHIACFCMQSSADAERIIALGADSSRVLVTGNIKFDQPMPDVSSAGQDELYQALNLKQGQKLFIAGSTHRGEEEIVLEVFQKLQKGLPDLVLLIAPRHPERFNEVEALIRARGMRFCRKTAMIPSAADVILLDTIGELAKLYSIGTVIFIGGSLVPIGGHNVLEPAVYKKPVLFGPHMDNFSAIAKTLIEHHGAIQVHDGTELGIQAARLFNDAQLLEEMGANAFQTVAENAGALKKSLDSIGHFIERQEACPAAQNYPITTS